MSNTPASRNLLGMRNVPLIGAKNHRSQTNREDRAIRLEFQEQTARGSCCVASYMVEAVTTNATVPRRLGVPESCPKRCSAWLNFNAIGEEMTL